MDSTTEALGAVAGQVADLEARIVEARQILDGHEAGLISGDGACYRIRRALDDPAPAAYRQPLETYRHGGALT